MNNSDQKRVFFALSLDDDQKQQVNIWCHRNLPAQQHNIALENYHLTLRYIGHCTPLEVCQLTTATDEIITRQISLNLNQLGHFKKPKVLYLGLSHTPEALQSLAQQVNALVDDILPPQTPSAGYTFTPHITIARKVKTPVTGQQPFSISMTVKRFALFESVSTPTGVVYNELTCWPLR